MTEPRMHVVLSLDTPGAYRLTITRMLRDDDPTRSAAYEMDARNWQ
jgi:hypothetical protein